MFMFTTFMVLMVAHGHLELGIFILFKRVVSSFSNIYFCVEEKSWEKKGCTGFERHKGENYEHFHLGFQLFI